MGHYYRPAIEMKHRLDDPEFSAILQRHGRSCSLCVSEFGRLSIVYGSDLYSRERFSGIPLSLVEASETEVEKALNWFSSSSDSESGCQCGTCVFVLVLGIWLFVAAATGRRGSASASASGRPPLSSSSNASLKLELQKKLNLFVADSEHSSSQDASSCQCASSSASASLSEVPDSESLNLNSSKLGDSEDSPEPALYSVLDGRLKEVFGADHTGCGTIPNAFEVLLALSEARDGMHFADAFPGRPGPGAFGEVLLSASVPGPSLASAGPRSQDHGLKQHLLLCVVKNEERLARACETQEPLV